MRTVGVILGAAVIALGLGACSDSADPGLIETSSSTVTVGSSSTPAPPTSTGRSPSPTESRTTEPVTSASSTTTPKPTVKTGPTTFPGPREPTAESAEDWSFPTAFGSPVPGKELSGVTCKAAREVWRPYLALPPDPVAGSSNRRELDDGWACYTPTTRAAADRDEGGIGERAAERQRFVLRHR